MTMIRVRPFGKLICDKCGKQIYQETRVDEDGALKYAVWCPTKECRDVVFFDTMDEASMDYLVGTGDSRGSRYIS